MHGVDNWTCMFTVGYWDGEKWDNFLIDWRLYFYLWDWNLFLLIFAPCFTRFCRLSCIFSIPFLGSLWNNPILVFFHFNKFPFIQGKTFGPTKTNYHSLLNSHTHWSATPVKYVPLIFCMQGNSPGFLYITFKNLLFFQIYDL